MRIQDANDLASRDALEASRILRSILTECPDLELRSQAKDRLQRVERLIQVQSSPRQSLIDPEVAQASANWKNFTSAADGRVLKFLQRYMDDPKQVHVLASIRWAIAYDIERWLDADVTRMQAPGEAGAESGSIVELVEFVKSRRAIADPFRDGDVLQRWDAARFNRKYAARLTKFEGFVKLWDVESARDVYRELARECPSTAQPQMEGMQGQLMAVERERESVMALISEAHQLLDCQPISQPRCDLVEIVYDYTVTNLKCQRRGLDTQPPVPEPYAGQLAMLAAGLATRISELWLDLATGVEGVDTVEELLQAYGSAREKVDSVWIPDTADDAEQPVLRAMLEGLLPASPTWAAVAIEHVLERAEVRTRAAESPEVLDDIASWLDPTMHYSLAPDSARLAEEAHDTVLRVRDAWVDMREGKEFAGTGQLAWSPVRFQQEESTDPGFRTLLDRLAVVREQYRNLRENSNRGFDHDTIVRLNAEVEAVLGACSHHVEAQALQAEIRLADMLIKLDRALQAWNADEFVSMFASLPAEVTDLDSLMHYRALSHQHESLWYLANHYHERPTTPPPTARVAPDQAISDQVDACRKLAKWMCDWQIMGEQLQNRVSRLPPVLEREVEHVTGEGMTQLERLVFGLTYDRPLSSELASELLVILEPFAADSRLATYMESLRRRAIVGPIDECLTRGQFVPALEKVYELGDPSTPSFRDDDELLALYLQAKMGAVVDAVTGDIQSLVDLISSEWQQMLRLVPGASIFFTAAARRIWDLQRWDLLDYFKHPLWESQHADAVIEPNIRSDITTWLAVIDLVALNVHSQPSIESLKVLVEKLEIAGRDVVRLTDTQHHVLKGLLQHWRDAGDPVLLAWAYRAFSSLRPSVLAAMPDPLPGLTRQSDVEARAIAGDLRELDDFATPQFAAIVDRLETAEQVWRRLGAMPRVVPGFVPGEVKAPEALVFLRQSIQSLSEARSMLMRLDDEDLRLQEHDAELKRVHRELYSLQVQYNRPVGKLKEHLHRLEALDGIKGMVQDVQRHAIACGNATDDAPKDPFPELINALERLVAVFESQEIVGRGMWVVVSGECWQFALEKGGMTMLDDSAGRDLRPLLDEARACREDEAAFETVIREMSQRARSATRSLDSVVDCSEVRHWLEGIPERAPRSRRVRGHFQRFMRHQFHRAVFARCIDFAPPWARDLWNEVGSP